MNEQTGLWSLLIADGETTPGITLHDGVGAVDVGTYGVHAQEEEAARSKQGSRFLEIGADIRIAAMLEHLDGDQIIEMPGTAFERPEILTDKTLQRQGRSSLDQTPQGFRGHIDSKQVEARVQEWQVVTAIAATDVET